MLSIYRLANKQNLPYTCVHSLQQSNKKSTKMTPAKLIDLRSDTVTQPSDAMRKEMLRADVGDDVYGEDPTVNRLQDMVAELTGQQQALFVSSGVQSNLIGLLAHCQRGDEYIVGQDAHTYRYEGGGAAVLGSIQPQPIDFSADGSLDLAKVANAIKTKDVHFARTKLLALENTTGGKVVPQDYLEKAIDFCSEKHLKIHMDGARIANAAVKQGRTISSLVSRMDSVSICLSKGLGAPVGSLICGSHTFIEEAKHWRKMLGGGMRQAGILAAAGIYAIQNNIERLAEDHENAKNLGKALSDISALSVSPVETNIIMLDISKGKIEGLTNYLKEKGIKASVGEKMRIVTHLDISKSDILHVANAFKSYFAN